MFGPLGFPELIFLLVLALLVFGPKKLPEIGRTLGKGLAELRKASNELKRTIDSEMEDIREIDPRRLLREEPPRRPAPKRNPSPPASPSASPSASPEPTPEDGRVARGETGEPAAVAPAAPEAIPATATETP